MKHAPMLDNILGQVDSLRSAIEMHATRGQAALKECGRLMHRCSGRVVISGMGASFFAAHPGAREMERKGTRVHLAESSDLLHFGEGSWERGDLALLISRSGGSVEVLRLAEKMRADGVCVIALTNRPGSELTQWADVTIEIGSATDQMVAVQTYTATVLALQVIAEQVGGSQDKRLFEEAQAALPLLSAHIDTSLRASEDWEDFLGKSDQPLYLLGRGDAIAAVQEGSLLFHETAKAPTLGMSSGQFRHGPVEAVDGGFRAVVIGTPARTRVLDRRLAADLAAMGARVRWIGPFEEAGDGVRELVPWPVGVPEAMLPLFDVVPLQVAAYRAAWWRGMTPGDFRYASEITADESGFPLFEASQG